MNELPIEYYNVEALHLIGGAIGNVLRVDTFTTSETRGPFARLCVQVEVGKPLATTVMIGCGRMGHGKENCPYVIHQEAMAGEVGMPGTVTSDEKGDSSRDMNVANNPRLVGGPTKDVQDVHVAIQDVVG